MKFGNKSYYELFGYSKFLLYIQVIFLFKFNFMIYFTCFFESANYVQIFSKNNFHVQDGDGEFQCKIDVSNLDHFKSFISELKSNNNKELLTILEDCCYDFESTGEDIPDTLEDEILEIIKN